MVRFRVKENAAAGPGSVAECKGRTCGRTNRARELPARVLDVVFLGRLRTRGRALGRRHLRPLAAGDGPPASFILRQLAHFRAFALVFARLALAVAEIRRASLGLGRSLIGIRSGQEYCGPEDGGNSRENFSHADHSAVSIAGETDAGYGSIGTLGRYLCNGTGVYNSGSERCSHRRAWRRGPGRRSPTRAAQELEREASAWRDSRRQQRSRGAPGLPICPVCRLKAQT